MLDDLFGGHIVKRYSHEMHASKFLYRHTLDKRHHLLPPPFPPSSCTGKHPVDDGMVTRWRRAVGARRAHFMKGR
jgi:hypothetical protein